MESGDTVSCSNGGVAAAARNPIVGRDRAAQFLMRAVDIDGAGTEVEVVELNGQSVALVRRAGRPLAACWINTTGEGINQIAVVLDPDKLAALATIAGQPRP